MQGAGREVHDSASSAVDAHDPYAVLGLGDFRLFLVGNLLAILGMQMQSVAVGWEIYERTQSAMALGVVGLVQVLPVIVLAIPAGQVADRCDRKRVVMVAAASMALSSLALAWISACEGDIRWMYACLLASGVARAFQQPAKASLLPQIVPRERFSNAVTWNTGGFQLAAVAGPALGGGLIWVAESATIVYLVDAAAVLVFVALLGLIAARGPVRTTQPTTARSLVAGLSFVWRSKVIFAAITLDLFAVLLGGATTLLPIFAKDILEVGPSGLGALRAAPAFGALGILFVLAHRPPLRYAGRSLLWAVVGFGLATIVFGLSQSFWLSLGMLFLSGAFDSVSVVVRHTLVQVLTPDEMRGRVSAVNGMFISASNELGGFESGLVAALFTPVISVVSGGIGTLAVVAAVARAWPQLRTYGRLGGGPAAP